MQHLFWWEIYGPFRAGSDGLPHMGDVFSQYFEQSGLTTEQIAEKAGYTVRYIQQIKNHENVNQPGQWERRRFFAKLFHIPPALLGIASVTVGDEHLAPHEMQHYESLLGMCWQMYYTSDVTHAASGVKLALAELNQAASSSAGIKRDQIDYMRTRFYQVQSVVSRDQGHHDEALASISTALTLSEKLGTPSLLASSLLRHARVLLGIEKYADAYADAMRMLPYAERCSDALQGKCYQMAGEATSFVAGADRLLQQKSMNYFNQALKIARKGKLEPDDSFVRTDVTSILIEKADAQRMFGQLEDALDTLAIARKHVSPEQHRWLINLASTEISIYLDMGKIEEACQLLQENWPLVKAVNIPSKSNAMLSFYDQAVLLSPDHPSVLALGRTIGE